MNLKEATQKSKDRYQDFWDQAPVAYHIIDRQGIIVDVNQTEADLLGYSKKEMLGRPIFDFVHPKEKFIARLRYKDKIKGEIVPRLNNRHYLKKDGSTICVSIIDKIEKNNQGKIVGMHTCMIDISAQIKAEQAAKEREEKYRNLIDNAHDGVVVFNEQGNVIYVNKALADMTGYLKKELTKLNFTQIIHPDDLPLVMARFKDRLLGKNIIPNYNFRITTKNRKTKIINYSGTPVYKAGKIIAIQGIIRDVSRNQELLNKIKNAKKHYEQVIDTIKDGICVISSSFEIESCNKTFAEKVNLPINTIKGRSCRSIIPRYEENLLGNYCRSHVCGETCGAGTIFKNGKVIIYTEKELDKDGNEHYHRISIFPSINNEQKIDKVVMIIRDITEQKIAEEEIRRLSEFNQKILDNSPVSIVLIDKEGAILSANGLAKKLMQKPDAQLIGKELINIPGIKKNLALTQAYQRLLKNGTAFYYENQTYTPFNEPGIKYLNIVAVPLYNEKKKIEGFISMALDNTEAVLAKKRLEELNKNLEKKVVERTAELDRINKELNKVLELKSKFLADASHELRTPLTIIQGNVDLAMAELKNNNCPASETYSLINKEMEKMSVILKDLTMLTNTDTKTEHLSYEKVCIIELIEAACESLLVLANKKNIKIICKNISDIAIMGDEAKLEKLLLNIVRNAIKYTRQGGRIEISAKTEKDFVRISILDTGVGIPQGEIPFIFERFYRVDKSRSREEGGTGLGLAIAKWIVEAHLGRIEVESKLKKGSTFHIILPLDFKKENFNKKLL